MVEIDTREFHGDRDLLARLLSERLGVEAHVKGSQIRIKESKNRDLRIQDIKDGLKRGLHRMNERDYRVTVKKGTIMIRGERYREHGSRKKGSIPTVQQTVPYFFPGS